MPVIGAKEAAGRAAAELVENGWRVGLGTGSTAEWAIRALGERVAQGLVIAGIPTSEASGRLAIECGIPLTTFDEVERLDITIDGADEVDPAFRLIKGGGAALVREKLVANASRRMAVVMDASKRVEALGAFPLPVAIVPFARADTLRRLQRYAPTVRLREKEGQPVVTDDGLMIADLCCGRIEDPEALLASIKGEPGVVDAGLFCGLATLLVIGHDDGRTETIARTP